MMKKILFTVAFASLVSFTFSQSIIPKAGVSLAKLGGSDVESGEAKFNLGFTFGCGFNVELGDGPFSVQPELNYIQKGFKNDQTINGTEVNTKWKISYIELPVLVKASFGEATKFYLNAGPSIAVGLGGKVKVKGNGMSADVDIKFGDSDSEEVVYIEKRMDFGLQFGGGVIIAEKVMIDVRYGLGLSPLFEDVSVTNNTLQFTVGIPLKLN
jgi:hypothetical protein